MRTGPPPTVTAHALADQPPRHRVGVAVDLDSAVVADTPHEIAQEPNGGAMPSGRSAMRLVAHEAHDRRLAGRAVSRAFGNLARPRWARCASISDQLAKRGPAIAFDLT